MLNFMASKNDLLNVHNSFTIGRSDKKLILEPGHIYLLLKKNIYIYIFFFFFFFFKIQKNLDIADAKKS